MRWLICLIAALLCGCSLSSGILDDVRQMTADDLANAQAKAVAANDPVGEMCWAALTPVPSPQGSGFGKASAIEDARIVALAVAGPCSGILIPIIGLVRP